MADIFPKSQDLGPDTTAPVRLASPRLPIHIRPLGREGYEVALFVPEAAGRILFAAAEGPHSDLAGMYRRVCEAVMASIKPPSPPAEGDIDIVCGNVK